MGLAANAEKVKNLLIFENAGGGGSGKDPCPTQNPIKLQVTVGFKCLFGPPASEHSRIWRAECASALSEE